MKWIAILFAAYSISLAMVEDNIEMVASGDSVIVSWNCDYVSGIGIWADSLVQYSMLPYIYCSIGIMDTGSDSLLLLAGRTVQNVHFDLLEINDLSRTDSMSLSILELCMNDSNPVYPNLAGIQILKQPYCEKEALFSCGISYYEDHPYVTIAHYTITMGRIYLDKDGQDGLSAQDFVYWGGSTTNTFDDYGFRGLVTDSEGPPMSFATVLTSYQSPYWEFASSLYSFRYLESSIEMQKFYSSSNGYTGLFHTAGSCSERVLGIWRNGGNSPVMNYSSFTNGLIDWSEEFPYYISAYNNCIAMSQNPADDGILLAWNEDDQVLVRHWDGEWNPYCHTIASDENPKTINVLSTEEGYWVGWIDDSTSMPKLVFVPRETVTEIEQESYIQQPDGLSVFPNPCQSNYPVTVTGLPGEVDVSVFDLSGRMVRTITSAPDGSLEWDFQTESSNRCSAGMYMMVVDSDPTFHPVRLIVLD